MQIDVISPKSGRALLLVISLFLSIFRSQVSIRTTSPKLSLYRVNRGEDFKHSLSTERAAYLTYQGLVRLHQLHDRSSPSPRPRPLPKESPAVGDNNLSGRRRRARTEDPTVNQRWAHFI